MDSDQGPGGETGGSPQGLSPAAVSAIVDALDRRAREAGAEGSASLVRASLGSVAEILGVIEARFDRLERVWSGPPTPEGSEPDVAGEAVLGAVTVVGDQVQAGLSAFNSRLGRLEEAFVQAVRDSGSGTDNVAEAIDRVQRAVEDAQARHDEQLAALRGPTGPSPSVYGAPVPGMAQEEKLGEVLSALRSVATTVEHAGEAALAESERQTDLLTQVASLSVTLEAMRATLDQLAEDMANSPGRKATEVGRRLAADLGILGRRGRSESARREPRELGPGSR